MTGVRSIKTVLIVAATATWLAVSIGAAAAHAEAAWWTLTSQARPAHLKPGVSAGSETQEITGTPAASGPYAGYLIFELKVESKTGGTFWNQSAPTPRAGWQPATAANIQSALEAAYGAGNVEVTGDPIGTLSVTVKTPVPVAPVVYTPYDNLPQ